ncbi:DUF721 domain-containing protein [Candidatus Pelagibacter bacterium]|nr:DUF721 domain-containing protein [Candidatus Pelagibacter bacterium]
MHNKNNNKSYSYIQGLRPFSSSIPKTLKKHLRKGGYNYSNIVDNWTKMISKEISDACYPLTVKMGKEMKDGTLVLNVIHGKELDVEYKKNEIIDKINCFFGYNCIKQVTLKVISNKITRHKKVLPKIKDLKQIDEKIKRVENNQLKNSLSNFLKAYNERNS